MKKFLSLVPPSALLLLATPLLFAQDASSPVGQPAAQAYAPSILQAGQGGTAEAKIQYFSLEHRAPDQMEPADAELFKKRKRDVLAEAEFYGYDMSAGQWAYEQSVCPLMPDYIMLRYSRKSATGAESIFTSLVPRQGGRILTVPVLHNGATRFLPAAGDSRNFQIFSQAVPEDIAKQNSDSNGKWLMLSVCYAEMTGARPQVPNEPGLDLHMVNAPPPTMHISVTGQEHEVRFPDPFSPTSFRLWSISYNSSGRIVSASSEEYLLGGPVIQHPEETQPKPMPTPPPSPVKTSNPLPPH
jgi:hypothetical protein